MAAGLGQPLAQVQAPAPLRVESLESPAGANSAQPQLTASADGVVLSWIERTGQTATLKFAERTATGWTPARTVASGTNWFVNWADVPSVVKLSRGALAAHWLQKSGSDTYAYDVRLSYSMDGGKTWAESFLPHHDGTRTEHGFASLFPMASGLGLIWLDGRAMTPGGHGGHDGGAMSLRYGVFDAGWKQVTDTPIDLKVCECCPTAAAMTADGPIVAFRDLAEGSIRDIAVSRLENGTWTEPVHVGSDRWQLSGCPVNGPALSARGRDVAIAWFSGSHDQNRAQLALSSDAGCTFTTPIRIDVRGSLGRVDVELLENGSAAAAWIEHADGKAELQLRHVTRAGVTATPVTVAPLRTDRSSGYPRLAGGRDELILAWTESVPATAPATGNIFRVRTAIARVR
jgi:hypothetical protein